MNRIGWNVVSCFLPPGTLPNLAMGSSIKGGISSRKWSFSVAAYLMQMLATVPSFSIFMRNQEVLDTWNSRMCQTRTSALVCLSQ